MYFSLKGVISTVCYRACLIINLPTTTKSLWLPMCRRQPLVACSTVPTADENAVTKSAVLPVTTVFQHVRSANSYEEWALVLLKMNLFLFLCCLSWFIIFSLLLYRIQLCSQCWSVLMLWRVHLLSQFLLVLLLLIILIVYSTTTRLQLFHSSNFFTFFF